MIQNPKALTRSRQRAGAKNAHKSLTGRVFGDLTVEEYAERRSRQHYYKCRCSCGRVEIVAAQSLRAKGKRACTKCVTRIIPRRPPEIDPRLYAQFMAPRHKLRNVFLICR